MTGVQTCALPILYVRNPAGVSKNQQRDVVDAVQQLNSITNRRLDDPEIATRVSQYELAFRMQTSVPELMDVRSEPEHVFELYGTKGGDGSFASNCLLARRLAESGVRYTSVYYTSSNNQPWDTHSDHYKRHPELCADSDRASAALISDQIGRAHV